MKNFLALVVVGVVFVVGASPVAADFEYQSGRVVHGQNYDGPGIGASDVAILATAAIGYPVYATLSETAGPGVPAASFIVWGASRTAEHRPDAVKAAISQQIALNRARPVAGSVAELLE